MKSILKWFARKQKIPAINSALQTTIRELDALGFYRFLTDSQRDALIENSLRTGTIFSFEFTPVMKAMCADKNFHWNHFMIEPFDLDQSHRVMPYNLKWLHKSGITRFLQEFSIISMNFHLQMIHISEIDSLHITIDGKSFALLDRRVIAEQNGIESPLDWSVSEIQAVGLLNQLLTGCNSEEVCYFNGEDMYFLSPEMYQIIADQGLFPENRNPLTVTSDGKINRT